MTITALRGSDFKKKAGGGKPIYETVPIIITHKADDGPYMDHKLKFSFIVKIPQTT
jgi:hypothetical protein